MNHRFYLVGALLIFFSGCASSTKQSDRVLTTDRAFFEKRAQITNVPFINQQTGQCGPATLTMALKRAGSSVSVDEITAQAYTPKLNGTLQTDMIATARRQGFLAIPIEGFDALLKEIDAGNPVIVFENLALSWLPQWHYALVFGYDLESETVKMHSGPEENKIWDFRKFERSWKLGDYWGLLVLKPDQLSKTASELAHATAAAGLEQAGRTNQAARAYRSMLLRWPESLGALIGSANAAYAAGDVKQAAAYLKKAAGAHPQAAPAWHNLAVAEFAQKKNKEARRAAARALEAASDAQKIEYQRSLGPILDTEK